MPQIVGQTSPDPQSLARLAHSHRAANRRSSSPRPINCRPCGPGWPRLAQTHKSLVGAPRATNRWLVGQSHKWLDEPVILLRFATVCDVGTWPTATNRGQLWQRFMGLGESGQRFVAMWLWANLADDFWLWACLANDFWPTICGFRLLWPTICGSGLVWRCGSNAAGPTICGSGIVALTRPGPTICGSGIVALGQPGPTICGSGERFVALGQPGQQRFMGLGEPGQQRFMGLGEPGQRFVALPTIYG
jgi:hypothetical protein